jgi:hypothetical protein
MILKIMNTTTSSDEQHRIQKAIAGKNGINKQDAKDEEIDNALDENASLIELTFENGIFRKIYNNGNPMNLEDRKNSLALDGRSKSKKENTKGKYGIGGFNSRCKLAGEGYQKMTSKDENDIYQCIINIEKLQDENASPSNCWTGEHKYRPTWEKINLTNTTYKQGVTKEYVGDKLKGIFNLQDVVTHIINKYNKNIKKGVKFVIIWDGKKYVLPDIYNFNTEIVHIDTYNKDGNFDYHTTFDDKHIKSGKRLTVGFKDSKREVMGNRIGTYTLNIGYPDNYNVEIGNNIKTDAQQKGYVAKEYINNNINIIIKNIKEKQNNDEHKIILYCGENNIEYDIPKNNLAISDYASECIKTFIPDITISMGENTLCNQDFSRTIGKGGDMGDNKVYQILYVDLQFDNKTHTDIDLSQETKDNVDIPPRLKKIIRKIIELKQEQINKKLKDSYNKLVSEQTISDHEEQTISDHEEQTISDHEEETISDHEEETISDHEEETISDHEEENIVEQIIENEQNSLKINSYYKYWVSKDEAIKICKQFINSFDDKITKVKPINQMLEHCKSV